MQAQDVRRALALLKREEYDAGEWRLKVWVQGWAGGLDGREESVEAEGVEEGTLRRVAEEKAKGDR